MSSRTIPAMGRFRLRSKWPSASPKACAASAGLPAMRSTWADRATRNPEVRSLGVRAQRNGLPRELLALRRTCFAPHARARATTARVPGWRYRPRAQPEGDLGVPFGFLEATEVAERARHHRRACGPVGVVAQPFEDLVVPADARRRPPRCRPRASMLPNCPACAASKNPAPIDSATPLASAISRRASSTSPWIATKQARRDSWLASCSRLV